jgi:hypothetical protein
MLLGGSGNDWFIYKLSEDKVSGMSSAEGEQDMTIES